MISYDPSSIYQRALQRLQQNPDWQAIASDSVISALLKTHAEMDAEQARYAEYLFNESKWDTAQNVSSITAAAGMLGYRPARTRAATGTIYVSADPRIHDVGKTISKSDFLDKKSSLNWLSFSDALTLTSNLTVVDADGNNYIIAAASTLPRGASYAADVNIIRGRLKTITIPIETIRTTATQTKLDPYLYIPVTIENCDNADTALTEKFFRVWVTYATTEIEYRVVGTLQLSDVADTDVEIYPDLYNSSLLYLKFNNSPERGSVLNISNSSTSIIGIRIQYIETDGAAGNVTDLFTDFTLSGFAENADLRLYGTNLSAIIGGKDAETIADIKENAPKFYMRNYSVGTKEAYESVIRNITFSVNGGTIVSPKKVLVYGGEITEADTVTIKPVTNVTFIADGIEDLATSSDGVSNSKADPYSQIVQTLNYYLQEIKSPQDTIRFVPPNFVGFAIGLKCTANRELVDSVSELQDNIRNRIEDQWYNSDNLDFSRNFYLADILADIKTQFPAIYSIKAEIEAMKKLSWDDALYVQPDKDDEDHTVRIPFSFNPVFLGNNYIEGFKDYQTGAAYVMRFDFFYKKSITSTAADYHTTIFIAEDGKHAANLAASQNPKAFFLVKDNTSNNKGVWSSCNNDAHAYPDKSSTYRLSNSYQYYFKNKVYSDDDFKSLQNDTESEKEQTIESSDASLGAIDNYYVFFSGNYDSSEGEIGSGWIEFQFDPIYKVLSKFAETDATLATYLADYPLSEVKCGEGANTFEGFVKNILSNYLDIYVSMRPVDSDLILDKDIPEENNAVLYIDTQDTDSSELNITNLTSVRRPRMISVEVELQ